MVFTNRLRKNDLFPTPKLLIQFSFGFVGCAVLIHLNDSAFNASSSTPPTSAWDFKFKSFYNWAPLTEDPNPVIEVNMGEITPIQAVATKGDQDNYVTSFKLEFSLDGSTWTYYQENGTDKVGF